MVTKVPNRSARLKEEIRDLQAQINDFTSKYPEDADVPHEEMKAAREIDKQLEKKLAEYSEAAQDERRAQSNRDAMAQIFAPEAAKPTGDGSQGEPVSATLEQALNPIQAIAEEFFNDRHFKAWWNELTGGGSRPVANNVGVRSPVVQLERSLIDPQAALITGLSSTSGGALVVNDRLSTLVPAVRDELNVVDLVTRQTTESDTVEYVRVTSETNNAAPVAEATSVSTGAKPESAIAMEIVTAIVENIAHWIPITRRALADAGQLRSYVEDFLIYGLLRELDDQILNGDGTSPNLEGVSNTSGVQTQAFDTDLLVTTRKAITKVQTVGGANPTAFVLTPEDWETIDLMQDAEDRYFFGGPMRMGTPVLWGRPVVTSESVAATFAYLGDWRLAIVWDREQATIHMTDSHSDFFIRNILVLLAEMRVAFGILRPAAFVEIDMSSA